MSLDTFQADEMSPPPVEPVEPDAAELERSNIYGTFFIGGNEFAVSVKAIQEVVNEPAQFTTVPLSPDYLLGLFNLRGLIIPVVDLRTIFGLEPDTSLISERKVAIIEHGEHSFGILVDKTGDVFNAKDVNKTAFSRVRGDLREAIVSGVFKLENGKRLVQILDPFELLGLDKLPRVSGLLNSALNKRRRGRRKQCISFDVGDCVCAFEMTSIKEIVELEEIDNSSLAHGWTLGAIDLRGHTVPVIDFRVFLGKKQHTTARDVAGKGYKLIVMRIEENLISFLVDAIDNIISYFDDDLLSFPGVGVNRSEMFKGCLSQEDDDMVLLLDHTLLLNNQELQEVNRGYSQLFQNETEEALASKSDHKRKRTLITFSVGAKFGLDIENVNEVMSFPDNIVHPPNLPAFIEGMVNLRGDLIPIINLRRLYGLEAIDRSQTKLLTFSNQGQKYGIMVDAVEAIVNLSDHNSNVMPHMSDGAHAGELSNDVKEIVLVGNAEAENQSFMLLDLETLVSRSVQSLAA